MNRTKNQPAAMNDKTVGVYDCAQVERAFWFEESSLEISPHFASAHQANQIECRL